MLSPRRHVRVSPYTRRVHDGHVPLEIKSEKIRAKAKKATTQYNKQHRNVDVCERLLSADYLVLAEFDELLTCMAAG